MALFEGEDGDVGPFAMAEDVEEWFPFTLDNLEMDRGCTPLQGDVKPMDQVNFCCRKPFFALALSLANAA